MTNILLSTDAGDIFYAILIIVFYVLSIILFFKVWAMTNNVKRILDILSIQFGFNETEHKFQKGANHQSSTQPKKNMAKTKDSDRDPLMHFYEECTELYNFCNSKEEFEKRVDDIIAKYLKKTGKDYSYLKDGLWQQLKQL